MLVYYLQIQKTHLHTQGTPTYTRHTYIHRTVLAHANRPYRHRQQSHLHIDKKNTVLITSIKQYNASKITCTETIQCIQQSHVSSNTVHPAITCTETIQCIQQSHIHSQDSRRIHQSYIHRTIDPSITPT